MDYFVAGRTIFTAKVNDLTERKRERIFQPVSYRIMMNIQYKI